MKWSSPPLFVIITLVILHFLNGVAGGCIPLDLSLGDITDASLSRNFTKSNVTGTGNLDLRPERVSISNASTIDLECVVNNITGRYDCGQIQTIQQLSPYAEFSIGIVNPASTDPHLKVTLQDSEFTIDFELTFCNKLSQLALYNHTSSALIESQNATFNGTASGPTRLVSMLWNASQVVLALDGQPLASIDANIPQKSKTLYILASPASECATIFPSRLQITELHWNCSAIATPPSNTTTPSTTSPCSPIPGVTTTCSSTGVTQVNSSVDIPVLPIASPTEVTGNVTIGSGNILEVSVSNTSITPLVIQAGCVTVASDGILRVNITSTDVKNVTLVEQPLNCSDIIFTTVSVEQRNVSKSCLNGKTEYQKGKLSLLISNGRCHSKKRTWIAIGVAGGVFLLILIFVAIFFVSHRYGIFTSCHVLWRSKGDD